MPKYISQEKKRMKKLMILPQVLDAKKEDGTQEEWENGEGVKGRV